MAGPASSCMRHPCGVGAYEIDAAGVVTGTGVDELDDLERLGGPSWARLLSHPVLSNSQRLSFVGKSPVSLVKRLKSAESDLRDRRRPRSRGCGEHWGADHRRQAACQGRSDAEGCQVLGGWWDATLNSKCCNGIVVDLGSVWGGVLGDAVSMPQLDECKRAKLCLAAVELEGCYRGQSMYKTGLIVVCPLEQTVVINIRGCLAVLPWFLGSRKTEIAAQRLLSSVGCYASAWVHRLDPCGRTHSSPFIPDFWASDLFLPSPPHHHPNHPRASQPDQKQPETLSPKGSHQKPPKLKPHQKPQSPK